MLLIPKYVFSTESQCQQTVICNTIELNLLATGPVWFPFFQLKGDVADGVSLLVGCVGN